MALRVARNIVWRDYCFREITEHNHLILIPKPLIGLPEIVNGFTKICAVMKYERAQRPHTKNVVNGVDPTIL